jgi:glycosyltransferase involved in cell wall biosynthesis
MDTVSENRERDYMNMPYQFNGWIHTPIKSRNSDLSNRQDVMAEESSMDKRLLVICHSYNNFQKDSIEGSSAYFKEVNVLVRTNPFAEISNYLPVRQLERFKRSYKIDLLQRPLNININTTPLWYLPTDRAYKSLGEKHFIAVEKAIHKHRLAFDLVHAHFTWSAGCAGARLKEEHDIPLVITAHGYDIYSLPFKDDEWREKIEFVLNKADVIITVSKSNQACIKKLDVSTPVSVIPNGFMSDLFYPRDSLECRKVLNLPLDKKIILTVGNLEPVKGQRYLLEAVKAIITERKDVLCIIVGVGRLHNALERQIRSLGLEKNIMLVGGKPHDEVPLWMNACDLFVLPSLNEGNPTVMFEALGCGKPFVGTKVGGIPEIINSKDYGLLVEPANPEDLAEEIMMALYREWDSGKILAYAEQYTWENIAKEIMRVYEIMF